MNLILILLGKFVLFVSKSLNLGSGSTWPGHIAMETNGNFVQQIIKKNPHLKIVLIAGTNGKTTTSLMLMEILKKNGLSVFRNEAGANLLNGIASSIIQNSNLTGRLNYDAAIFEVDENNLTEALNQMSRVGRPADAKALAGKQLSIVLLNLFRDQLDRYGEVNTIAKKWQESLTRSILVRQEQGVSLFTNGDDPKLSHIAQVSKLESHYFGIEHPSSKIKTLGYDIDFTYCPKCQTKLEYSIVTYSHLGKFACPKCGFTNPKTETFPSLPHSLFGKYNIYNTNAAALVAKKAFGVPDKIITAALGEFKPAFGRQEAIKYKNRDVLIMLSKNPAGFNQSIDAINSLKKDVNILLVLNDRIPDGRDVSWIWDVDFDLLPKTSKIFISGDRCYDMGLRIKYLGDRKIETNIISDLEVAIDAAIEQTKPDETLVILPTYSAMLEARKILTGKKIL